MIVERKSIKLTKRELIILNREIDRQLGQWDCCICRDSTDWGPRLSEYTYSVEFKGGRWAPDSFSYPIKEVIEVIQPEISKLRKKPIEVRRGFATDLIFYE